MSPEQLIEFNNPIASEFAHNMKRRWYTMKAALNIYASYDKLPPIVETGCVRNPDDWGAGMSSVLIGRVAKEMGYIFHTVDISEANMKVCQELTKEYSTHMAYHVMDSVEYLKGTDRIGGIGFLYLDSYDYPIVEIADMYAPREDYRKTISMLWTLSEEEIVSRHGDMILPSQEHCLKEITAAMPNLDPRAPVLIDDCALPGGGKGRLAKLYLREKGYTCILDNKQSLWLRIK